MSARPVEMLAPEPTRTRAPVARPSLRLVASHGVLSPHLHAPLATTSAVRATRRGRLVATLIVAIAVAALALALAASVDAAAPQIDHATRVLAGQTLSQVAASQLPSLPIPDAVARIQLVNGLNTSQVHAGQTLLIPTMP